MADQATQTIPKGYKQIEVGVIPSDWDTPELGEVIESMQLGGNYKNSERETSWPLIKMGNLGRGNIKLDKLEYIVAEQKPSSRDRLEVNDVLFNTRNTLDLVGKIAIWRNELPEAYFNSNIMRIKFVDSRVASDRFMNLVLNTSRFIKALRGIAIGTTSVAAVYSRDLVRLKVPLPTKAEQEAIAEALSDADVLIKSLEKLIAKKCAIKQGTMQELLTGKRRLPGFSGKWETKKLGDVSAIKTGKKNNEDKVEGGQYPFFVRSQTVEKINSYSFEGEAILVPGEGGIGSIFHYIKGRFDYHQRVYKISNFTADVCGKFVYYCMAQTFNRQAMRNSVKATVDSLRLPTFLEFEFLSPSIEEQTTIATVLSDMDVEIERLEQKLVKYKMMKQGMMQVLLTGKIRLMRN